LGLTYWSHSKGKNNMSLSSKIEWTEATWNPVTGCTKISEGCKYCYAEKLALRLKAMNNPRYINGFDITLHDDALGDPLKWHKPKRIFVNSMSDLFHEKIPISFIEKVFKIIRISNQHIFQILTKRSKRLLELAPLLNWPDNLWMGVTVEMEEFTYRISHLKQTPAKVKFISFEPLLNNINMLDLREIDWVIVGGESGPKSRTMEKEWVTNIKDHAINNDVAFFFKQWGGKNKKKAGRLLDGKTWSQTPQLRIGLF
jgi:protein gp37